MRAEKLVGTPGARTDIIQREPAIVSGHLTGHSIPAGDWTRCRKLTDGPHPEADVQTSGIA